MSFQPKKNHAFREQRRGLQRAANACDAFCHAQLAGKHLTLAKMVHRTTHKGVGCLSGGWRYWRNKQQQDSRDF